VRVGEAVIRLLEARGVDVIFGIPGVHTIEFYRGLAGSSIRAITPRSEAGAGFMADAYARVTGRPGVCILVTGPGVTNAATPIAEAFHDSIPLLVIAGAIARPDAGRGHGPLHDLPDQAGLLSTITAISRVVADAAELPALIESAWRSFETGRPRPVHVGVPTDLLEEEADLGGVDIPVGARTPATEADQRTHPDPTLVREAAALLADAARPMVLLGGGAVDAGPEAITLAELVDAPVAMTGNARGIVPSGHPLCLGSTLPLAPVQALFAESDAVLLVGTELSPVDTMYTGLPLAFGGPIVRIDIDPEQLHAKVSPAVAIGGDAAAVLGALGAAVRERRAGQGTQRQSAAADRPSSPPATPRTPGPARVRQALAAIEWSAQTEGHRPWLDALEAALPRDRIVAIDSTQLAYSAHHYMPAYRARSWLAPYGFGTLGTALPQAIGAKIAAPDRPVVAITGDGGLLFTIGELATAVDLGAPLPIIVWDNQGYGEIRDAFDRAGAPRIGTETTARDLPAIARGFGCAAVEAEIPERLGIEVSRALSRRGPTLIHVLDPSHPRTKELAP